MFRCLSLILCVLTSSPGSLAGQDPEPTKPSVRVPTYPNSTCPIMGKKVSMPLFVDTEMGRFYLCCKPCVRKVLRDVPAAHKTAYARVETLANEVCPVSGEPIGEDAVEVTLQGYSFKVCCEACVAAARKHHQTTLVRLHEPDLVEVGNQTCPIRAKPVVPNAFVVIDDAIVNLSSPRLVAEARKDPGKVLAKARKIAAAQPKPEAKQPPKDKSKDSAKEKRK